MGESRESSRGDLTTLVSSCRCSWFPAQILCTKPAYLFPSCCYTCTLCRKISLSGQEMLYPQIPAKLQHCMCPPSLLRSPTRLVLLLHRCRVSCLWMGQTLEQFMLQSSLWNQAEVRVLSSLLSLFFYLASFNPL